MLTMRSIRLDLQPRPGAQKAVGPVLQFTHDGAGEVEPVDKDELLKIFDREQRIEVDFPGVRREVGERVIRTFSMDERFGFIPYSSVDETNVDAEIEAQIAYFSALGVAFEWKVYDHDRPADLRQRLASRGFAVDDPEALMVLDLENAPDFYWSMPLPQVERITDLAGVQAIRAMEDEVWGTDHAWMEIRLINDLEKHPHLLSIFAVCDGSRAVSASWIYYHPPSQFASLWGGTTLPEYRRRGYYTALLAIRAREARERGYRFLTVDASPMSRPILEKHGFQFLGFSTPCVWRPQSPAGTGEDHG
jgi:GNAT superfamily N-acetyltransferase